MTNSEPIKRRAAEILDRVTDLLDEGRIAQHIDERIDKALDEFDCPTDSGYSHPQFTETVARFLTHVHEVALPGSRKLTASQARDEALALLSHAYDGAFAGGYHGAILDAADASSPGLELVLARMAESIKRQRRQQYSRWLRVRYIDSVDWPTKCAMAAVLLARCQEFLPPELRQCPPEQVAEEVYDLLELHAATSNRLGHIPASFAWPSRTCCVTPHH
jgi:hypothetical protein